MKSYALKFIILFLILVLLFVGSLSFGAVKIPLEALIDVFIGNDVRPSWEYIISEYRFPKSVVGILVGIALSISGMFMQTLFRNPMADSYILGVSSGSSLGVALVIMGSSFLPGFLQYFLHHPLTISLSAILGSFVVMNFILICAKRFTDTNNLLIIGLMFSSFASAFVGILAFFTTSEQLQRYTFWSMGSLGNVSWFSIYLLFTIVVISFIYGLRLTKPLNALLIGEAYAQTLGVSIKKIRLSIVIITCVLCGVTTAFVGPIAFVGLAVPHISRLIFKTQDHFILFFSNIFIGANLLLLCDIISQLPGTSYILPINAITSIIGAPIVIFLLLRIKR